MGSQKHLVRGLAAEHVLKEDYYLPPPPSTRQTEGEGRRDNTSLTTPTKHMTALKDLNSFLFLICIDSYCWSLKLVSVIPIVTLTA